MFRVINKRTGKEPDLWKLARRCKWAKHLCYCDMEGFAIEEDGTLILLDECGNVAYPPHGMFKVVWERGLGINNIADDLHDAHEEGYKDGMRDAKKHGHWEDEGVEHYSDGDIEDLQSAKCSACGRWHTTPYMYYFHHYDYCPHCGAKMEAKYED